jgi:hypothetical protein
MVGNFFLNKRLFTVQPVIFFLASLLNCCCFLNKWMSKLMHGVRVTSLRRKIHAIHAEETNCMENVGRKYIEEMIRCWMFLHLLHEKCYDKLLALHMILSHQISGFQK